MCEQQIEDWFLLFLVLKFFSSRVSPIGADSAGATGAKAPVLLGVPGLSYLLAPVPFEPSCYWKDHVHWLISAVTDCSSIIFIFSHYYDPFLIRHSQ